VRYGKNLDICPGGPEFLVTPLMKFNPKLPKIPEPIVGEICMGD